MAKKIFEKAGLITPPGAQTSRSAGTSQPGHEAKPKTAPGAMLQFIGQQSAAVREVEELRERLREFDGAAVVRSIDPEQLRASRWQIGMSRPIPIRSSFNSRRRSAARAVMCNRSRFARCLSLRC